MRHVAPLLLALAACADDPGPPTYPDLIGTWAVEWTCLRARGETCQPMTPMTDSTSVTIGAHSEIWWSGGIEHASTPDGGPCAFVAYDEREPGPPRGPYYLCARPDGSAQIQGVRVGDDCSCLAFLTRL